MNRSGYGSGRGGNANGYGMNRGFGGNRGYGGDGNSRPY